LRYGQLAVNAGVHGTGLGAPRLMDALLRTAQAAETVGAWALLVHAKDEGAKAFYGHFTFEADQTDNSHCMPAPRFSSSSAVPHRSFNSSSRLAGTSAGTVTVQLNIHNQDEK
jgi:predicted N-acetyltransferase YhbS